MESRARLSRMCISVHVNDVPQGVLLDFSEADKSCLQHQYKQALVKPPNTLLNVISGAPPHPHQVTADSWSRKEAFDPSLKCLVAESFPSQHGRQSLEDTTAFVKLSLLPR